MTNEVTPFNINISLSDALNKCIIILGNQNNLYGSDSNYIEYEIVQILNIEQCLCKDKTFKYRVFTNNTIHIPIKVVLYDEIKHLKFIKQTKLFEDGK